MPAAKDYSGLRFGRLVAEEFAGVLRGRRSFLCKCDCGNKTIVAAHRLVSGQTTSCGCRKLEVGLANIKAHGIKPRHGMTNTPTHKAWSAMIERCRPSYKRAHNYVLRGVTVCERWLRFENFLADMGPRPSMKHSIDRIDNNGPYSPKNCRWATAKEQQRNKRNTRYLLINGQRLPLMEVAEVNGIKKSSAQAFFSTLKKLLARYDSVGLAEE